MAGNKSPDSPLSPAVADLEFEQVVKSHYTALYRFALSLTQQEADAADLTQQTFYLWATRGHQLRDASKLKTWLFTTLYREFLGKRRHLERFPHYGLSVVESELPSVTPTVLAELDATTVLEALQQVDEPYRAALTLFYLDDRPYKDIAEVLGVPIGTVMSRLARGKEQLRRALLDRPEPADERLLRLPARPSVEKASYG